MTTEIEEDPTIHKIAILGTPRCGKTTLGVKLSKGIFKGDIPSTKGIDFHVVKAKLDKITLQIWDYAGQSHYRDAGIFVDMVKGSSAFLFCYDASDPSSMKAIDKWIDVAKFNRKFYLTKKYLVGLKADLIDKASALALTALVTKYLNNPKLIDNHFIISTKDDLNVDMLIRELESDLLALEKEQKERKLKEMKKSE